MTNVVSREQVEALVRQALKRHQPHAAGTGPVNGAGVAIAAPRLIANISARHAHLSQQALDVLFGPRRSLTVLKPLYQPGAYAAEETVTIFGPRKQMISNLRVLGPLRDACQVELAFSDARFLGIDAPVRVSGDIAGSAGCYLVGPHGGLELSEGVIRAARHVHMNPAEAGYYGVTNGEGMRLLIDSAQSGVLDDVTVRIGADVKLEVHVDTDEGNAVDLINARKVTLERTR
ncbi:MAG: phosphate propanoyltransferase [bacterium]|nr:phosphate propanoyltransferase [bacterium]